ncbi:MAG: DUF4831 family protein [Bacteroidales bacterium]
MNKFALYTLLFVALIMTACSSQQSFYTSHVSDVPYGATSTGIYYALPRTVIAIEVTVEKTTDKPGPYAEYASRFLGLDDVIHKSAVSYQIHNTDISGYGEPDPDHVYHVTFPEGEERQNLYLTLTEAGLIASVNKQKDDSRLGQDIMQIKDRGELGTDTTFNLFINTNLREKIDTIVEEVRLDTITIKREKLRKSWVEKSNELRAREVADYIMDLRTKKLDLISGFQEIPYSKEALEYMYSEMDSLEQDYLDLFTGISHTETITYRFIHTPAKNNLISPHILFRFSSEEGVLPADNEHAAEVTLSYKRSHVTDEVAVLPTQTNRGRDQARKGIYYRIPEYADVMVHEGDKKLATTQMLVSQFGRVTNLPPDSLEIEFFPNTGAVKSVGHPHTE